MRMVGLTKRGGRSWRATMPCGRMACTDSRRNRSHVTALYQPDIRKLRERLGLSQESMSRALDVSARSVERWEAATSASGSADIQRRLALMAEIAELATEVFGDEVQTFMTTPRRSLGMRTPREALIRGDLESVRRLLVNALEGHWA